MASKMPDKGIAGSKAENKPAVLSNRPGVLSEDEDKVQAYREQRERISEGGHIQEEGKQGKAVAWVEDKEGHAVPKTPDAPPKLRRDQPDPGISEGVAQFGGREADERRDIGGRPITPEDAKFIQHKEAEAGNPTGKGSLAARAQSASAANVREGKVSKEDGRNATIRY
ncbi:hypothetical protein SUGI_0877870 [Cryptomeria japonica]|uniref:uncharacterized protein LOC131032405 n=1 Tax=Cryptomeria japonica TaxID=3369 RepID=UPI002414732C|nr:uncharacterized protein LOC131032405 [Cryptomeria japonica]GLJ42385.1 hypothetical protein SUGI_0877870 [Cryptomeria japonica]